MKPSSEDWALARRIYAEFRAKPESRYIALEHALAHLAASVRRRKPEAVLELGAGIGTITKLLLEHPHGPQRIVATEDHPVCIEALASNLEGVDTSRLTVVHTLEDLLKCDETYALAICDGGFADKRQFAGIWEGAVCFFEGSRGPHRRLLADALAERGLEFEGLNYARSGWRIFLKRRRSSGNGWRWPKIKRRKGCWIGNVVARTNALGE